MTLAADTGAGLRSDLAGRLATLREMRGPEVRDLTERVREVVILAGSSRSGSSMVAETLRTSRALLHLRGEINPFLRVAGLGYPDSGEDSDSLDASCLARLAPAAREVLEHELALDIGTVPAGDEPGPGELDVQFALDTAARLVMQWPQLPLEPDLLVKTALAVLAECRSGAPRAVREDLDAGRFLVALATELRRHGLAVDPSYYDLPRGSAGTAAPDAATGGAPGAILLEEPPFILPRPWRRAGPEEAADKPLLIKTPSNAYRLGFLRALFPRARFRVIHLTRNPAATINGLHDGWLHHGFHAHRMVRPLGIQGYVERHPHNRWWWKFDLPPGWREFTEAPLLQVCAFQWRSAHQAVLGDLAAGGLDWTMIRFEDLIRGQERRTAAFERLADWLRIPFEGDFRRAAREGIGPVVATLAPRAGRWRDRAARVEAALDDRVKQVAERLGYRDPVEWI